MRCKTCDAVLEESMTRGRSLRRYCSRKCRVKFHAKKARTSFFICKLCEIGRYEATNIKYHMKKEHGISRPIPGAHVEEPEGRSLYRKDKNRSKDRPDPPWKLF
jgi:hypothetical protein